MTANLLLFSRLILRPLRSEPVRTLLTLLAVALGVSVVVAIDLAGQAAAGSFHSSLESLAGTSDLVITATGGIDEKLLGTLDQLPFTFNFAPRIEDFAAVDGKGEALPFIGLDLIGQHMQEFEGQNAEQAADLLSSEDPIWVGTRLHLRSGDHVRLLINDALHDFTVAGVLEPHEGEIGENNAIVADIGLAQKVTGKIGKLDSIDVRVPPGRSLEYWSRIVSQQLPASTMVEPQGSHTDQNRKMLSAFRWNLRVLSYIALVVGAFLIYNTISISVVRRRNEIGVLRALGATRTFVTAGFLVESLFFAVAGSAAGLLLGRVMALGAVKLIGKTVQSLYVSSEPAPIHLTAEATLAGLGLGISISLLAALCPAFEAGRVPPVEAMARGREELVVAVHSRTAIWWALPMLIVAAFLAKLPPVHRQPFFAYLSVLLLISGTAVAIPTLVTWFASASSRALGKLLGVEALLAMRSLRASLGRTSVLTAALATAVAMTASVGIMVGSFRDTVSVWMDNQLKADLYLRPPAPRLPTVTPP